MSGVLPLLGIALVGAFFSLMLSEAGCRGGRLVGISAAVSLFLFAVREIPQLVSELEWITDGAGVGEAAACALKIVGIGYVSGIAHDICVDMGQRTLASSVLTVGKIEMLTVTVPMISEVLRGAAEML